MSNNRSSGNLRIIAMIEGLSSFIMLVISVGLHFFAPESDPLIKIVLAFVAVTSPTAGRLVVASMTAGESDRSALLRGQTLITAVIGGAGGLLLVLALLFDGSPFPLYWLWAIAVGSLVSFSAFALERLQGS